MNLSEIQSLKQIGKLLRSEREARGLTLPAVAGLCGITIAELVRIENAQLLDFRQALDATINNADKYAKALDVELDITRRQLTGFTAKNANNDDVFIPVFLRKNNYFGWLAPAGLTTLGENSRWFFIA